MTCYTCNGERRVGYLKPPADNPAATVECFTCEGTGQCNPPPQHVDMVRFGRPAGRPDQHWDHNVGTWVAAVAS